MLRSSALLIATALVVTAALPLTSPAAAGRRGDTLAGAAKAHRKAFKQDAKAAESSFAAVVSKLTKGLPTGQIPAEDAVTSFGNALSFYASSLNRAATDAAEGFAGEVVQQMSAEGDPSLPGGAAGDGGSYDAFVENLRTDMGRYRAKARKGAAKLQKVIARSPGQRGGMRVTFEDWPIQRMLAPDVGGARDAFAAPPRLWGAVAARLTDGRIFVTAFGSAAPERDNTFDVRLLREFTVKPLGSFLPDGGMNVNAEGWWSFTGAINDPFSGDTLDGGNAQIYFGVDPDADDEPSRREHGGILSIP